MLPPFGTGVKDRATVTLGLHNPLHFRVVMHPIVTEGIHGAGFGLAAARTGTLLAAGGRTGGLLVSLPASELMAGRGGGFGVGIVALGTGVGRRSAFRAGRFLPARQLVAVQRKSESIEELSKKSFCHGDSVSALAALAPVPLFLLWRFALFGDGSNSR